jgi:uncharacterized protein
LKTTFRVAILGLGLALCLLVAPALATSASASRFVPARPSAGPIVDESDVLSVQGMQTLRTLNERLRTERAGAELGVLIISSTDGEAAREYATKVFNEWKLGTASANNGVILMVAKDDRKVELVLGDGVDSAYTRRVAQTIINEQILAKFRAGNFESGVLAGSEAVAKQIFALGSTNSVVPQPVTGSKSPTTTPTTTIAKDPEVSNKAAWGFLAGVAAAIIGFFALLVRVLRSKIPRLNRRRPRKCPTCTRSMELLDERADDAKLTKGQLAEERVGSVDYDVWVCPVDQSTQVARYGKFFNKYDSCPKCNAQTKSSHQSVLSQPTQNSTGVSQVDERCANCDFRNTYTGVIAQLMSSSMSNTSSFHSSSSGSSSSSSSSGGGHSSGGGGSGSW